MDPTELGKDDAAEMLKGNYDIDLYYALKTLEVPDVCELNPSRRRAVQKWAHETAQEISSSPFINRLREVDLISTGAFIGALYALHINVITNNKYITGGKH